MAAPETIRPLMRPAPQADPDAGLLRSAELGSKAAFAEIAARYDGAILSLLLALSGSEQVALDLCHASLLAAYRQFPCRREPSLYLCFYRLAVNHWLAWSAGQPRADHLRALSSQERLVFTLKSTQRLGLDTIAQILGLPRDAVSRIFVRAVSKLRCG